MSTPTRGAYVPPHLRNRSGPSSPSPSSSPSSVGGSTTSSRGYNSAPTRSTQSRTPWSAPASQSTFSPNRNNTSGRLPDFSSPGGGPSRRSAPSNGQGHGQRASYGGNSGSGGGSSSPSLYIFGDSFVGPMKLLRDECVQIKTFKGSSAKGLNNPNSIKQVSKELVPILNHLLAPPPYAYVPSTGKWALLVFGNVDLQINYLWQLANKPLTSASFPSETPDKRDNNGDEEQGDVTDTEDQPENPINHTRRPSNVLATATETSSKGPALGPESFVKVVVEAYTSWLEREIVNGPVGKRLLENAEQRREGWDTASGRPARRRAPPSKVLIAAALPPLIEDELLPRIPEKYVERLEEDHEKAQRAMVRTSEERGSRTPWAKESKSQSVDEVEVGLSTLSVSDDPAPSPTSPRSASSSSSDPSAMFDSQPNMESSIHSTTSAMSSPPPSATTNTKTPITTLLTHDPPLCTLPVRVEMTNTYNAALRAFCEKHSDIFGFVDISEAMHKGSEAPSIHGEVDRNVWACPVDPTNVHPLWEPTLPLWMKALAEHDVPTEEWRISEDAEETFRAYEIDKRRRTEKRAGEDERIKLRDE
ncbi:hypothetical protein CI109_103770 [Kwoniella shandongensis]|uniref:Uncharacterized protein n=1 Tax=Kwoniella shandongensis TaxID=1734106 RepID=A0A5M6C7U6_9TREE|nr:uncharacterized protein CI109_000533 [Kwoniella shandongensis]KAA5530961.1 hypothetical protein CI109_000533 [Kwoniella shandongensis]